MRLGAYYGFPSTQTLLGVVYEYGSLGVRRNEIEGTRLLYAAAFKGDRVAQQLLTEANYARKPLLRPYTSYDFARTIST